MLWTKGYRHVFLKTNVYKQAKEIQLSYPVLKENAVVIQYVDTPVQYRCIQVNLGFRSRPAIEGADLSSFWADLIDCLIITSSAK